MHWPVTCSTGGGAISTRPTALARSNNWVLSGTGLQCRHPLEFQVHRSRRRHFGGKRRAVDPEDLQRLSPLHHELINLHGRYTFSIPDAVRAGHLRPLPHSLSERRPRDRALLAVHFETCGGVSEIGAKYRKATQFYSWSNRPSTSPTTMRQGNQNLEVRSAHQTTLSISSR